MRAVAPPLRREWHDTVLGSPPVAAAAFLSTLDMVSALRMHPWRIEQIGSLIRRRLRAANSSRRRAPNSGHTCCRPDFCSDLEVPVPT
ncbi:hypothetical protein PF003_g13522 [Phytophthora fragariae]|nr:hypothetical protein PF003_g13522 [Phytophthora fragariae]